MCFHLILLIHLALYVTFTKVWPSPVLQVAQHSRWPPNWQQFGCLVRTSKLADPKHMRCPHLHCYPLVPFLLSSPRWPAEHSLASLFSQFSNLLVIYLFSFFPHLCTCTVISFFSIAMWLQWKPNILSRMELYHSWLLSLLTIPSSANYLIFLCLSLYL